ncbi:MAG: VOC family protein [Thermoanaerobaculia bacterium]
MSRAPEEDGVRAVTPSFTVTDLRASIRWYTRILGCAVIERWERQGVPTGASLSLGGARLVLSQDDGALGAGRSLGAGVRLYFRLGGDLDAFAASIVARGGTLTEAPAERRWGGRDFSLDDPDGYHLTFATDWEE